MQMCAGVSCKTRARQSDLKSGGGVSPARVNGMPLTRAGAPGPDRCDGGGGGGGGGGRRASVCVRVRVYLCVCVYVC